MEYDQFLREIRKNTDWVTQNVYSKLYYVVHIDVQQLAVYNMDKERYYWVI